jgi:lipopolysaccharide transport system permease protein
MSKLPVKIYVPNSASQHPFKMWGVMFKDLKASQGLAYQLTKRDISAQYRQSLLGLFWAFFTPLFNSLTWIFLQSSGIINLADTGIPYPAYVFIGTMMWQILTESIASPIQQVQASKSILSKLNFPREAILLSGLYKVLFNAAIKILILIPILLYFGVFPDWKIIFLPLVMFSFVVVGFSIGLFLTPIGTLYSDIGRAIPMVTQVLMFLSPVVFMMPESGITATIFKWNFTTPLLMTARDVLSGGDLQWFLYFSIVTLAALFVLFFAWIVFRITMPVLIERMSA